MDLGIWITLFVGTGTAVLAFVGARVGLPGRTLLMTYVDRRLKVISNLLNNHKDRLSATEISELEKEIREVVDEILVTSNRMELDQLREWRRQSPLRRVLFLPRPRSITGYVLTIFSYIYLASGIIYVALVPVILSSEELGNELNEIGLVGFVGSILLFTCLRRLSLIVARRDLERRINGKDANNHAGSDTFDGRSRST